jgi:hypothetical protein
MSSLFSQLFSVLKRTDNNPYEDYLTEIFAEVLDSDLMLESFISQFVCSSTNNFKKINVGTQATYPKLEHHDIDSRPDMVMQFTDGEERHILFIENKIGSHEGYLQLSRYADHLMTFQNAGYVTHLMYITKFHDPKDRSSIMVIKNKATFESIRWYQIYNWLVQHRNEFIDKVIEYMEELQLNESRRFTPQDIYAIQNIDRVLQMMNNCLDGPVTDTLYKLFGKPKNSTTSRINYLNSDARYMLYIDLGNWVALSVGLILTMSDYPLVSIVMEVNPESPMRVETITAFKNYLSNQSVDWQGEYLDNPSEWSNINCDKELLQFLSEEDHISRIQEYLMAKLKELHSIVGANPQLGWKI